MAPTQPFKPRVLRIKETQRSADDQKKRRHPTEEQPSRMFRSRHRSRSDPARDSSQSKPRGDHKKSKRARRYDVVKKLDVGMDGDAITGSDEEYGSDLDLEKPLYAIGEYLGDRTALVRNMFDSLKKDTLNKLIPSVLRDFSLKELEEKCVFELDGMSRKRARAILSGQDLQSSSGTDDSEDEIPPPPEKIINSPKEESIAESLSLSSSPTNSPGTPAKDGQCMSQVEPTELELVELELRAQALRAMMRQLDDAGDASPKFIGKNNDSKGDITDVLLDETLHVDKEDFALLEDDAHSVGQRKEKDFFEIHVDEEELASFD